MRKRLVRHIVSLGFVFSVVGYAYYEYLKTKESKKIESQSSYFLTQQFKDLSGIKIKKEKKVITLLKKNQDWFLKKPLRDVASFSEVSRWFDEVRNQRIREIFIEGDIVWKDYYLERSPEVQLEFSNGSSITFLVSSKSSFDEKYFIKRDNKLFVGEKYFFTEVNSKSFDSFRRKKIIPSYGHPIKVVLKSNRTLSLNWDNYKWSFKEKDFPLSNKRLDDFWSDLSSIEARSFKERATAFYLKKYGLDQADYQIQLSYSGGKKTTIKINPVKNNQVYVYGSHRDYILEISKEDMEKIKISKNDIRDHGQAFRYEKDKVSSLELKSEKISYSVIKKKDQWVSLSSPKKKVDSKKVQSLLNSIYKLRGQKYKKGNLKKVAASIIIKGASGKVLLELKSDSGAGSIVWVQTNLSKGLVAISKSSLDLILQKHVYHSVVNLKKDKTKKSDKSDKE